MHFSALAICAAALCGIASAYPTEAAPRSLVARDCSAEIAAMNMARREKRGLPPRSIYPTMPNEICVLAPEISKENYLLSGSVVRNDVTDGEPGVALTMDIGVLDMMTCQPLPNAMVEIWSTNAQGQYSPTALRGAYPSAANGIAEIQTIFPGFNSDGANHLNIAVHSGNSMNSTTSHNGRVFFTDGWTNIISMSSPPYQNNPNTRTLDLDDPVYIQANSNGYTAVVDIEEIEDDWPEGIVGYITVGINPSLVVD
ncbi:aromatic compound dioxygenase [Lentinula raphanica]|uniref:Aromatic compound dioxygenase n=1 Tax=Lentinula raphanica TaxID=153919 RepID=A0AA38P6T1_9AGAR|nr:aromatic compound dioxygenase [Lentinula raphanica]KAJ3977931.1 aromatic compound dioxygenase [Lentinula raphanica]